MRTAPLLAALLLASLALPVASAGHTYDSCMQAWYPAPPPGWSNVCATTDWASHNPFTPLASCLLAQLEIYVVGVSYDVQGAIACL